MSFIHELKRRNVFRVGIAYVLISWVLLQGADFAFDLINAPNWVIQALFLLVVLGLPGVLVFAWVFEMTPEGIKREKDVDRSQSMTARTGRKLDNTIIAVLVIALGYFVFDKYSSDTPQPINEINAEVTAPASEAADTRKSIAVLPFANRSSREEDEFFSDGIHDD